MSTPCLEQLSHRVDALMGIVLAIAIELEPTTSSPKILHLLKIAREAEKTTGISIEEALADD